MTDAKPTDYSALISKAEKAVAAKAGGDRRDPTAGPGRRRQVLVAAPAGVTVFALAWVSSQLAPPGKGAVARDLDKAVELARNAVDDARKTTGELPATLPNAALASVVSYEPAGTQYRLAATIMGVRVTLEPNGSKTVDMGVQE